MIFENIPSLQKVNAVLIGLSQQRSFVVILSDGCSNDFSVVLRISKQRCFGEKKNLDRIWFGFLMFSVLISQDFVENLEAVTVDDWSTRTFHLFGCFNVMLDLIG